MSEHTNDYAHHHHQSDTDCQAGEEKSFIHQLIQGTVVSVAAAAITEAIKIITGVDK